MICQRCLLRTNARQLRASSILHKPSSSRFLSSTTSPQASAAASSVSIQSQPAPPAVTSDATAQPLSTPSTSSATPSEVAKATKVVPTTQALSSVAAGTVLKGLNYFKNKQDPVALEDHEYPEWLWSVLAEKKKGPAEGAKEEMDPRLFSKSAKARRMANKRARKEAQLHPEPAVPVIPLYEQSIDLPAQGEAALTGRTDLTKAMRGKRRRDIKEANFLKGMT